VNEEQRDSLDPLMVARFEVENVGSPVAQKKIVETLQAVHGVAEVTFAVNTVYVRYRPLEATDKRLKQTIQNIGVSVKAMATDLETPHPHT